MSMCGLVGIYIKSKPILDKHDVVTPGFIFTLFVTLEMNKNNFFWCFDSSWSNCHNAIVTNEGS